MKIDKKRGYVILFDIEHSGCVWIYVYTNGPKAHRGPSWLDCMLCSINAYHTKVVSSNPTHGGVCWMHRLVVFSVYSGFLHQ